jgi:two-component system, OmpR family, sensor kinase
LESVIFLRAPGARHAYLRVAIDNQGRWVPVLIAGAGILVTIVIWWALRVQEHRVVEQAVSAKGAEVGRRIEGQLEMRIEALVRMARRWELDERPSPREWSVEAQLHIEDFGGYQAIEWVDPEFRVRWVVPLAGNEAALGLDLAAEERRRQSLLSAKERRQVTMTPVIELVQGGRGFLVYVPIFRQDEFDGFILGVFRVAALFDTIIGPGLVEGYAVEVFEGDDAIYVAGERGSSLPPAEDWASLLHYGVTWRVRVRAAPSLYARLGTPLPAVVFMAGFVTSLLLAAAVHFAQTARARARQAESAHAAAREALGARDEFLSIASHELRTPLTALVLQVQALRRLLAGGADQRLVRKVEAADRQTNRLARLVEGLLDVSRLRAGRLVLEREAVDLGEVTREMTERFREEARAAGCDLRLSIASPARGHWDRLRLEQVITNLVSNAIKYGGGAPVDLSVRTDGAVATLAVRDYGIGVSAEDLDRIFERFERAVSSKAYAGLGLGLYITRRIVEAHGGHIRADRASGSGTVFTVTLPLAAA